MAQTQKHTNKNTVGGKWRQGSRWFTTMGKHRVSYIYTHFTLAIAKDDGPNSAKDSLLSSVFCMCLYVFLEISSNSHMWNAVKDSAALQFNLGRASYCFKR